MELFQENSLLYNITVGVVVMALFLLVLKLIKNTSNTVLVLIGIVITSIVVLKYFPSVAQPIIDFIGGSWMD